MLFMPGGITSAPCARATVSRRQGGRACAPSSAVSSQCCSSRAAPAAAQQGVTDTEIVLGCSNSFSGPLAFTGEQITKFGVDLYFRVVNDAGGIHGRKVRTVYYDDGYRPQDAVANTRKLVEQDGVFAVIMPAGLAAGGGDARVPRGEQGADAVSVPELAGDAGPALRVQGMTL